MRRAALLLSTLALLAGALALAWWTLPDPAPLARAWPRRIAVLEQRRAEAARRHRPFHPSQRWVGLEAVARPLVQAVILSEDAAFWVHGAFDLHEIGEAARAYLRGGRRLRGASTLTQQLARTLWLGTERSAWRKAREALLALKIQGALPRRRILALYLGCVEWGDGVFGAEAAARRWFDVPAAELTTAQAVLLASALPAPRRAEAHPPPRWLARRARRLLDRMLEAGRIDPAEHARAGAELERILAGASGDEEPPAEPDAPAP